MRHANPTRGRFAFKRDRLPSPAEYYREQGLKLTGGGEWKSAICQFHDETRPSLRVRLGYAAPSSCMTCGAQGRRRARLSHAAARAALHRSRKGTRGMGARAMNGPTETRKTSGADGWPLRLSATGTSPRPYTPTPTRDGSALVLAHPTEEPGNPGEVDQAHEAERHALRAGRARHSRTANRFTGMHDLAARPGRNRVAGRGRMVRRCAGEGWGAGDHERRGRFRGEEPTGDRWPDAT